MIYWLLGNWLIVNDKLKAKSHTIGVLRELGQWALSAVADCLCSCLGRTGSGTDPLSPCHTLSYSLCNSNKTYDLFQFCDGHIVHVVVVAWCWWIMWSSRRMRWGYGRRGAARCGAVAMTFGLVTGRRWRRHRTGQSWAILGIAIGRQTWGKTQRFGPLCQTAYHFVFVFAVIVEIKFQKYFF